MEHLAQILIKKNISISSVESFTVGSFANEIGSIIGISAVYKGSLVSYQTCIKRDVLEIDEKVIQRFGVVSQEIAGLMAIRGQKMFDSDVCISFTGNAGPKAMEEKPVGLIYIGVAYAGKIHTYEFQLTGSRQEIKEKAVRLGIQKILEIIK